MSIYDNLASPITNLIPFDDLIVMTSNSEWCVNGSDKVFCASPAPVAKLQSCYGSSKIKPVISGSMVLFVQSGGNIVRDLGYSYLSDSYDGQELSLLANHLFMGKTILDMAYAKEPNRILYCIMNDGTINALTYNPKQKISAWHKHITKGEFESIAVIRENNEDTAYFIVKRNINNQTVRYIEKLNALLDYGVVKDLEVDENGVVNLPYPAKKVLIGLGYDFELETLNLETEGTLGLDKIINMVEVKILNSREDFFIVNDNNTYCQNARSHDSVNNPNMLYDKDVQFCPLSNASLQKSIKLVQKNPLPINILAISATISLREVESI